MKTLLLVDCHNILYRSFYAITESLSDKDQLPTNALFGFVQSIFRMVQQTNPSYVIFCLDSKEKTLRTEVLDSYKANRPVMPDKMILQMKELFETVLPALQIPFYAKPGFEADDIIATFTTAFKKEVDQILLLSSDRDLWQLLGDEKIKIISPAQTKLPLEVFTKEALLEKIGITPDQVVDYKSLVGDPSDNILGVPGVGPKTAQKWLNQYQSLDRLLVSDPPPSPKIQAHADILKRNQSLIKLDEAVPVEIKPLEAYTFHGWDWSRIEPMLQRYQFHSLIKRYKPETKAKESPAVAPLYTSDPTGMLCWVEEQHLCVWHDQTIQKHDITSFKTDSLFTAPAWFIQLKEQWLSPGSKNWFFDLKTLAHRLLLSSEELRKISFDDLMIMWYLQEPNRKEYSFQDWVMTETNQEQKDAIPLAIDRTRKGLSDLQLEAVYQTLEKPLLPILFEMETRGIYLSKKKLIEAKKSLYLEQKSIESTIYQQTGVTFNLQSPKQLGFILYEKMQLPPLKKTKTGYSTDAEALESLMKIHPVGALVLQYREVTKLLNTYLEPMEKWLDVNQLIHTHFIQAGPSTGRLTSVNPNLQALPQSSENGSVIRSLFEVRNQENLFISADYSQIDLRVLAHLSQDPVMKQVFLENGDIHNSTARNLFHLSPKETPTPAMRKLAKTVQFGIIYGMSPYGLSQTMSITSEESRQYIQAYFHLYQGVQDYIQQTIREAKQNTFVQTIAGRKRPIPELSSSRKNVQQLGERLAVNTTIQGSSADILKSAMIHLDQALFSTSTAMVLTIHDEIIVETPKSESERTAKLLKEKMENAWQLSIPLIVHLATGSHLGNLR